MTGGGVGLFRTGREVGVAVGVEVGVGVTVGVEVGVAVAVAVAVAVGAAASAVSVGIEPSAFVPVALGPPLAERPEPGLVGNTIGPSESGVPGAMWKSR
jgi:hypothetical protein